MLLNFIIIKYHEIFFGFLTSKRIYKVYKFLIKFDSFLKNLRKTLSFYNTK